MTAPKTPKPAPADSFEATWNEDEPTPKPNPADKLAAERFLRDQEAINDFTMVWSDHKDKEPSL